MGKDDRPPPSGLFAFARKPESVTSRQNSVSFATEPARQTFFIEEAWMRAHEVFRNSLSSWGPECLSLAQSSAFPITSPAKISNISCAPRSNVQIPESRKFKLPRIGRGIGQYHFRLLTRHAMTEERQNRVHLPELQIRSQTSTTICWGNCMFILSLFSSL